MNAFGVPLYLFQSSSSFLRISCIFIGIPASQSVQDSFPDIPGKSGMRSESDHIPVISTIRLTIKLLFFSINLFKESGEYQNSLTASPSFTLRSFAIHLFNIIPLPEAISGYSTDGNPEINE